LRLRNSSMIAMICNDGFKNIDRSKLHFFWDMFKYVSIKKKTSKYYYCIVLYKIFKPCSMGFNTRTYLQCVSFQDWCYTSKVLLLLMLWHLFINLSSLFSTSRDDTITETETILLLLEYKISPLPQQERFPSWRTLA